MPAHWENSVIDFQIAVNSGTFVFLMVRYASLMWSPAGRLWFFAFIAAVLSINFFLLINRYDYLTSFYKSIMISGGFILGVFFVARSNKK